MSEENYEITFCDKIIDTVGYKYPLGCLALFFIGLTVFAIVISENNK